jgi:UDP-N-acetylglucosamine acyltransferase
MRVHPTALVDPAAQLGDDVEIGPFAVVGPDVQLARGVVLRSHVVVCGRTSIGEGTVVYPFTSIGDAPQDLKYRGETTQVVIGRDNQIREHVTIQRGTAFGGGRTVVGDHNLLMVGVHLGHDCRVGSHIIMGNGVLLAGHVQIEDYATLYGQTAVQQFLRVGESAFLAAKAGLMQDLPPFVWSQGHPARALRVNRVGLERRGFEPQRIADIERAFRMIFRSKLPPRESLDAVREHLGSSPDVQRLVSFLEKSERGFVRVRSARAGAAD